MITKIEDIAARKVVTSNVDSNMNIPFVLFPSWDFPASYLTF